MVYYICVFLHVKYSAECMVHYTRKFLHVLIPNSFNAWFFYPRVGSSAKNIMHNR
jgi:hypothetical protein